MSGSGLVVQLARFAGGLRARGVDVSIKDELDGATALTLIDLFDREEVRRALKTAFKVRRRDLAAFDEAFERFWDQEEAPQAPADRRREPQGTDRRGPPRWEWDGRTVRLGQSGEDGEHPEGDAPGYSPDRLLRHKPFEECSPQELAAMERVLARAVAKLATRRTRRYVPARARGKVDLRRSFRRAVGSGGELFPLARRDRALKDLDLVLLCDTSGSMDPHVRFILTLLLAVKRVARRTEVFVFNTSLTRITPWIAPGKIGPTLQRLAGEVPDWSGGTRIGESLAEFVSTFQNQLVTPRTVVVIVSDGLDTGEAGVLTRAMRAIHAQARRVLWLNPLLGDTRYEPTARGMQAALPFVDHFAAAHTLAALEDVLPLLAA